MRYIFWAAFFLEIAPLFAQKQFEIAFVPYWNNEKISFPTTQLQSAINQTVAIETLKFYVSNIVFLKGENVVYSESNSYHLINFENDSSLNLHIAVSTNKAFDSIRFCIGIDSVTNMAGVMNGALDPTNGMYWTWQSGYINVMLEGVSPVCATRKNRFQFHLGGFAPPNPTIQHLQFASSTSERITIGIQLNDFFNQVQLSTKNQIMSPGKDAVELSKKFAGCFTIRP